MTPEIDRLRFEIRCLQAKLEQQELRNERLRQALRVAEGRTRHAERKLRELSVDPADAVLREVYS